MVKKKLDLSKQNFTSISKRTNQGGRVKTSSMNKSFRKSFKKYRGQGK